MKVYFYLVLAIIFSFLVSMNIYRIFPVNETSLFITVIGLIYGLIAAFTINNSWERFSKIRDAISEETSAITNIAHILKQIGDKKILKNFYLEVIAYCKEVIEIEWYDYWSKEETHEKFNVIFEILGQIKSNNERDLVLLDSCYEELRDAARARTEQLVLSQSKLSKLQWILIIFLSLVLSISIIFLSLPGGIAAIFISGTMISSIVLIFFVIYELNNMKFSEQEVSISPYLKIIANFQKELKKK